MQLSWFIHKTISQNLPQILSHSTVCLSVLLSIHFSFPYSWHLTFNLLQECDITCVVHIYRPQTKSAKVMFSQISVCTQRGLGLCPGGHPLRQRPPWTKTPWTETPRTETYLDRDPLDRDPPGQRTRLDRDPHRQRPSQTETPHPWTVMGGRYTCYWNAFLFQNVSTSIFH